jgi:cold shock CspA family protein
MLGTVAAFDEAKGYGTVRSDGGEEFFFHCTEVLDGSRTIEVNAAVEFDVAAGQRGRYEARHLRPTAANQGSG